MSELAEELEVLVDKLRAELAAAWEREEAAYEKGFRAALILFGGKNT